MKPESEQKRVEALRANLMKRKAQKKNQQKPEDADNNIKKK